MEVRIERPGAALDMAQLQALLQDIDPAVVLDREALSGALRVSTVMGTQSLLEALRACGLAIEAESLVHLPSVCCGGCSG